MKVVLFCGGYGMRMRNSADEGMPKPMQMVGPRPLIWHVMRYYAHFGHKEFILCLGYGASHIKNYFLTYQEAASNDFVMHGGRVELMHSDISDWSITFVDTGLESAIGERLRRVRRHLNGEEYFLANYADVLTDAPMDHMIEKFHDSGAAASMMIVPPQSSFHCVEVSETGEVKDITPVSELPIWETADSSCSPKRSSTSCLPAETSSPTSAARWQGRAGCSVIGTRDSGSRPTPSRNGPSSTLDTIMASDRGWCGSTPPTSPRWALPQSPVIQLSTGALDEIAVVGAHCDDIAIGMGGTLLTLARNDPGYACGDSCFPAGAPSVRPRSWTRWRRSVPVPTSSHRPRHTGRSERRHIGNESRII